MLDDFSDQGCEKNVIGASKIARDVTTRKLAERALVDAKEVAEAAREAAEKANRVKDEFLATLGHELRTPLNAMLGWAAVIRTGSLKREEMASGMEAIERNARLQAQIIIGIA